MGLAVLIIGLVVFLGGHVFVTRRDARAALIARIGEVPYKALFALVSILGVVLIVWGFAHARAEGYGVPLWQSRPSWLPYLTELLVWPAFILVTAAYIPGDIKRTLKHPMLAGIKLWALAHLLSNSDPAGIILFGSILAWAVYDRISLKRRTDAGAPPIPIGGRRNDMIAIVVGTILFVVIGLYHPVLFGPTVFGRPALGM